MPVDCCRNTTDGFGNFTKQNTIMICPPLFPKTTRYLLPAHTHSSTILARSTLLSFLRGTHHLAVEPHGRCLELTGQHAAFHPSLQVRHELSFYIQRRIELSKRINGRFCFLLGHKWKLSVPFHITKVSGAV